MKTKKITEIIDELLAYENCVFRGENQQYGKVSSKLYRQYFEGENLIENENFSVLDIEKNLTEKARLHIRPNASNIEVLTELQHYGGKTALIDFTYNMLVALFFACDGESEQDGRIIVFDKNKATQKMEIDYKNQDIYRIIAPTGKNQRVIFQSSVFIHTEQGYVDEKDCKFITIEKQQKKALLEHLRKYFNIETATIYNDIHGFIQNQDNYITAETEFYRSLAYHNNQDFKQAINHYDKAIEINPQLAAAYSNRGAAKYALRKYQEAIVDCDKAIEINPQLAEAYSNRGLAKSDLGDKNGAIADYDKAIEINPQYADAYYNRGGAKYALGKYQEAIEDYDKAIKINPQLAEAYSNRGSAKSDLGDKNGAIADIEQAKILYKQQGKMEKFAKVERLLQKIQNDK